MINPGTILFSPGDCGAVKQLPALSKPHETRLEERCPVSWASRHCSLLFFFLCFLPWILRSSRAAFSKHHFPPIPLSLAIFLCSSPWYCYFCVSIFLFPFIGISVLALPSLPSFPFLLSYRSTWLPALTFRVFSPSFLLFFSGVAGEEIKIGLQKLTPIWGLRGNLTQVWSSRELHFTLWCWISRFNNGQKKAENSAGLS